MIIKRDGAYFIGYNQKGADAHGRLQAKLDYCTDCGGWQEFGPGFPVCHTALCPVRLTDPKAETKRGNSEEVKREVLEALFKTGQKLLGISNVKARRALKKLREWVPESSQQAEMPFLSEAYLYPLLGKEDARTLLSLFSRLEKAIESDET